MGPKPQTTAVIATPAELSKYDIKGPFWTAQKDGLHKIQYADEGVASEKVCPSLTLIEVFEMAAKNHPTKPLWKVEDPKTVDLVDGKAPPAIPTGDWLTWTTKQALVDVKTAARGLMALGFVQYDSLAILGFNSPWWVLGDYASIYAGGKCAGIYPTDTTTQITFKVEYADASIILCETFEHVETFKSIIEDCPYMKAIVCWGGSPTDTEVARADGSIVKIMSFDDLKALGEAEVTVEELDERSALVQAGNCAVLIFTSGTTGNPKACMISHDNIMFESYTVLFGQLKHLMSASQQHRIISYLPLSHVAGNLVDAVCPLMMNAFRKKLHCTVFFARAYDLKAGTIKDRLQSVQPTLFLGVPRVWEKIAEKVKAIGAQTKGVKKKLATWAKSRGLEREQNQQLGQSGKAAKDYGLAKKLILSKIRGNLGLDKCQFAFAGAAPMTMDTLKYFAQLGINVNEVYGMSENTGAATFANDACHQWGSCGPALPGTEVKIFKVNPDNFNDRTECPLTKDFWKATDAEQGEVCYRGRHIMMGYLANPRFGEDHVKALEEKNMSAIDEDGWLHSGDMGCINEQNMLKITGRYKELIIGAGGENIAPVPIEDEMKALCPFISNIMMIGDQRKFNCCLITLKADGATGELAGGDDLDGPALNVDSSVTTISAAMEADSFISTITNALKTVNANGEVVTSNAAKIQKYTILPRDFSVEGGELTATLKLRRSEVDKKYATVIDAMYAPEAKDAYVKFTS